MDAGFDFQLPLLVVSIAGIAGVLIYMISVFGMQEKTFEEAIAEQKEISVELLGRKDQKKKVTKRKVKNKKEDKSQTTAPPAKEKDKNQHSSPHVEICEKPTILEEGMGRRLSTTLGGRRDSVIKSILVNKSEHSPVGESADSGETNHFESIHPKDDCELKKQVSLEDSDHQTPEAEEENGVEAEIEEEINGAVVEPEVTKVEAPIPESQQPITGALALEAISANHRKSSKKPKKSPAAVVSESELNATKLVTVIDKVTLTSDEIQNLIEYLLNRQMDAGISAEWVNKSKSENVASLKKALSEREKALSEEQATVETLQQKLKELRTEFGNEKTKLSLVKKQLEERNNTLTQETQSLQVRLQQINSTIQEKQGLERQVGDLQRRTQGLHEENLSLKKVLSAEQSFRMKGEGLEREAEAIRTQCTHLESQLKSSFQSNSDLAAQVRALQDHSRGLEMKVVDFDHLQGFSAQLQERESHLINELQRAEAKLVEADGEKNILKDKVRETEADLRLTKEEGERRIEESHQMEKNAKNLLQDTKSSLTAAESQLKAKDGELRVLANEKEELARELHRLSEKVRGDEEGLEKRLIEAESAIQQLRGEKLDMYQQLTHITTESTNFKQKNDELRGKNMHLMEQLRLTEENLAMHVKATEKTCKELEASTRETLLTSIQNQLETLTQTHIEKDSANWLVSFAKTVESWRLIAEAPPPPPPEDKSEEIKKLEGEVQHYQTALKTTESLLRSLDGSIEKAESEWREKVRLHVEEFEELRKKSHQHTEDLQAELEIQRDSNSKLLERMRDLESHVQNSNNGDSETPSLASIEELTAENEELRAKLEHLIHTPFQEVTNGNGTAPEKSVSSSNMSLELKGESVVLAPASPTMEPKKKKKGASVRK